MATYRESITALVANLKTIFGNTTMTEAQAIAASSAKPNTIFYTSDTHCIVLGGTVYGRGTQIDGVFRYCPSTSTPGQDPDFSNPDYIYIQPDSSGNNFTIWWCNPGNSWSSTSGFNFDVATDASDITYDLTNTPDLGEGDVQSAIEAVDAKAVTESTDSQSGTFKVVKLHDSEDNTLLPMASSVHEIYQYFSKIKPPVTAINFASTSGNPTLWNLNGYSFAVNSGKTYIGVVSFTIGENETIGAGGTLKLFPYKINTSSTNLTGYSEKQAGNVNLSTSVSVGNTYYAFVRFTAETQTAYFKITCTGAGSTSRTYNMTFNFVNVYECDDNDTAVLIQNNRVNISQNNIIFDTDITANLEIMRNEYYQKGVADGAGMASIVGLGYNIFDYITGRVNLNGFEYGCSLKKRYDGKEMTTSSMFKENTSLVYMPVIDYTNTVDGTLYYMFYGCKNLVCVPPLNLPNKGNKSAHEAFAGCSKLISIPTLGDMQISTMQYFCTSCTSLLYVPDITANTVNVTNYQYAFSGCTKLLRIEGLDFTSANGTWAYNASYNMFRAGGGSCSVRYMLLKNFGKHSGLTGFMAKDAANWGINSTNVPDARQSLVDSLLTYSFDRATAEYANCTVTLSAATLAVLTEEEKTAITAKGYILTS